MEHAMADGSGWSKTWTFFENDWHEGNPRIMGPRSHASWLASSVFDGARAFEGVTPDLDRHLARINRSALTMGLKPIVSEARWMELAQDGLKRFDKNADLYIRPMYWGEAVGPTAIAPDPESTAWCLSLYELAMPAPDAAQAITLSPFRRPSPETMPVDAKAGCLYPNNARAILEATSRGFDNALVCDMLGNVAETASSNVFMVRDGSVFTPAPNGTFLDGITRQRVIRLLRADGVKVIETSLRYRDFQKADEIFSTGNYAKVLPIVRIDDRSLQPGPIYRRARELYWTFARN
jgi:branched-chain amino acid aminotransferase